MVLQWEEIKHLTHLLKYKIKAEFFYCVSATRCDSAVNKYDGPTHGMSFSTDFSKSCSFLFYVVYILHIALAKANVSR